MGKVDWYENQIVLYSLGKPNALSNDLIDPYLALFSGAPTDSSPGTEIAGSRLAISAYFITTFNVAGELKNIAPISWPAAVSTYTAVAAGIFDGAAGTQLYRFGLFSPPRLVEVGKVLTLAAGKMLVREG